MLDQYSAENQYLLNHCCFAEILALWQSTVSFPIWCTSDRQGHVLKQLSDQSFIICDYWYHAFIARDWYRHYQRLPLLQPADKSGASHRMMMYCRTDTGAQSYRQSCKKHLSQFRQQIWYDWDNVKEKRADFSAMIDIADSQRAGIHLVLETLFDTDTSYLTEKIFKPMVMSQAFLIWGPPKTLEYLKDHGFKTFSSIWCEDYDQETDHTQRMSMLLDLCEDLLNLSDQEFKSVYQKCLPIIEHNRTWFYSDHFMQLCWERLQTNFAQAIQQRHDLLMANPGGQLFSLLNRRQALLSLPNRSAMAKHYFTSLSPAQQIKLVQLYPWISDL